MHPLHRNSWIAVLALGIPFRSGTLESANHSWKAKHLVVIIFYEHLAYFHQCNFIFSQYWWRYDDKIVKISKHHQIIKLKIIAQNHMTRYFKQTSFIITQTHMIQYFGCINPKPLLHITCTWENGKNHINFGLPYYMAWSVHNLPRLRTISCDNGLN